MAVQLESKKWQPIWQPKPASEVSKSDLAAMAREFCGHLKPIGILNVSAIWRDGETNYKTVCLPAPVEFERLIERKGARNLLQCAHKGKRWFVWIDVAAVESEIPGKSVIEWVNPLLVKSDESGED